MQSKMIDFVHSLTSCTFPSNSAVASTAKQIQLKLSLLGFLGLAELNTGWFWMSCITKMVMMGYSTG